MIYEKWVIQLPGTLSNLSIYNRLLAVLIVCWISWYQLMKSIPIYHSKYQGKR